MLLEIDPLKFFDPYSQTFNVNPIETYIKLRSMPSIWYWKKNDAWVITEYEQAIKVQQDPRFSTNISFWKGFQSLNGQNRSDVDIRLQGILGGNGPAHIELRKLIMPYFLADGVKRYAPFIAGVCEDLIAHMAEQQGPVDIVNDFAKHIPISVISHILGIPDRMQDDFLEFSLAFIELFSRSYSIEPSTVDQASLELKMSKGIEMIGSLISDCKTSNLHADGLISRLIRAQQRGEIEISDQQLIAIIGELVVGGSDTTVLSIAFTIMTLLRDRTLANEVQGNPELWPNFVQEVLRHQAFIKFGPRFATQDVTIDDAHIEAGQMVSVLIGAVQRDCKIFVEPDRFLLRRDNSKSIAFGRSGHACIGKNLALAETISAASRFMEAFPNATLADEPIYSRHNKVLREITSLKVNLY